MTLPDGYTYYCIRNDSALIGLFINKINNRFIYVVYGSGRPIIRIRFGIIKNFNLP